MKRTIQLCAALIICTAMVSSAAWAAANHITPAKPASDSIEVNLYLTAQFPTYPDASSFTASSYRTPFTYQREGRGMATIRGEDIPRMIFSTAEDAPGGLDALTVYVDGIPGTTATLNWTAFPAITLSPVEYRIRVYDKVASQLSTRDTPIMDFVLSDLTLSTAEACAEGMCTSGYLDAENLEAQLVFETMLPETGYALFDKWLANEPMLGELRIQLPNPFAEER